MLQLLGRERAKEGSCLIATHNQLVMDGDYRRVKAFMAWHLLEFELIAKVHADVLSGCDQRWADIDY